MLSEFKKATGRVKKDAAYFPGLYAMCRARGTRGQYVILAPDMETLRSVWSQLHPSDELVEALVQEVGIFQKESVTDAISK